MNDKENFYIPDPFKQIRELSKLHQIQFHLPLINTAMSSIINSDISNTIQSAMTPFMQNQIYVSQSIALQLEPMHSFQQKFQDFMNTYEKSYISMNAQIRKSILSEEVKSIKKALEKLPKEDLEDVIQTAPLDEPYVTTNPDLTDFAMLMNTVIEIHGFTITVKQLIFVFVTLATLAGSVSTK